MRNETKLSCQFWAARLLGWMSRGGRGIRILTYHSIWPDSDPIRHISPELFESHIRYLSESGYKSYRVCDLVEKWPGILDEPHTIIITFDDGLQNNRTLACPILNKYGLTATFFVPTAYIKDDTVPSKAPQMSGYAEINMMSWKDLRQIVAEGHEVGAHSHTHVKISQLPRHDAINEIKRPKEILEINLNKTVYSFAYPKGRACSFAPWTCEMLMQYGYRAGCSTLEGLVNHKTNLLLLPRNDISGTDNLQRFKMKLEGCYDCLHYLRRIRQRIFKQSYDI